jgi:hypothetical protein
MRAGTKSPASFSGGVRQEAQRSRGRNRAWPGFLRWQRRTGALRYRVAVTGTRCSALQQGIAVTGTGAGALQQGAAATATGCSAVQRGAAATATGCSAVRQGAAVTGTGCSAVQQGGAVTAAGYCAPLPQRPGAGRSAHLVHIYIARTASSVGCIASEPHTPSRAQKTVAPSAFLPWHGSGVTGGPSGGGEA